MHVYAKLPERRDGVDVHRNAGLASDRGQFPDGLHTADLVVRPEERDESDVPRPLFRDRLGEYPGVQDSVSIERKPAQDRILRVAQPLRSLEGRVVLAIGDEENGAGSLALTRPVDPLQREIDGLSAPGGQRDLGTVAAEVVRDPLSRGLESLPGVLTVLMRRGGIPDLAQSLSVG